MQQAICLLSVIPMRKEPSHRSEMVSQVLFGEYVSLGEDKEDFVFVRCHYDGYEGWVQSSQVKPVGENEVMKTTQFTNGFALPVVKDSAHVHVSFATPVYNGLQSYTIAGSSINYLFNGQQVWNAEDLEFNETTLHAVCQPFINTPYLWGGRSVFGVDCSGFAQQVFKLMGIKLLRDAYLQAEQGRAVDSLQEAKAGDLAFFQNEKGRITHVGIILSNQKIVHASGRVRIDTIDAEGILNDETGKRTHNMHSIRRYH